MLDFINNKRPDLEHVGQILEACAGCNHWANRGPVYYQTAKAFAEHMGIPAGSALLPCSNGGVALEVQARLLESRFGRKLRWVASAFSFHNLGRGYFSDIRFVDTAPDGMLDIAQLEALDPDEFDGFIVVNPFGMAKDFSAYVAVAQKLGKELLLDNAAGVGPNIPAWPWQSFSLHHTKPYGFGEGGFALVPQELADDFYALIDYGALPDQPHIWMNNGKVSDLSCAFHLSWLHRWQEWAPLYRAQAERIDRLARELGLLPILPVHEDAITMSRAYRCGFAVPIEKIRTTKHARFGKYYKPLSNLAAATGLFEELVNIPTHPDMATLSDDQIREDFLTILGEMP